MKKQSYIIIASAILVVTLATTSIASAASAFSPLSLFAGTSTGTQTPSIIGKVSAINGTTLTITNKKGVTYTIDASSATVQTRTAASEAVSSIKVGDKVAIVGTVSGSTVTAQSIFDKARNGIGEKGQGEGSHNHIAGTITAISGDTITIEVGSHRSSLAGTDITVTMTSTTPVTKNGESVDASTLVVGNTISIKGTVDTTNKTVVATGINIVDPAAHARVVGTVQNVSGSLITLTAKNGSTRTIDASTATIVTGYQNKQSSSIDKIQTGDKILVIGAPTTSPTDTVTATMIEDIHR